MSNQFKALYLLAVFLFVVGVGILAYSWLSDDTADTVASSAANVSTQEVASETGSVAQNSGGAATQSDLIEISSLVVPAGVGATPTPLPTITPVGGGNSDTVVVEPTAVAVADSNSNADTAPAEPTPVPTEAVAVEPTAVPTVEPTAVPPTPTAVPEVAELTGPSWLQYLNLFRAQTGLPLVDENERWSGNSFSHSQYMVANTTATHGENEGASFYTNGGRAAGVNGNIAIAGWAEAPEVWSIDYWMTAPFHAVPLLDPHLHTVGYGVYTDAGTSFKQGGTIQFKTGLSDHLPEGTTYPIMFPSDGAKTWVLSHRNPEFPDPLDSCPGFQRPTGAPIIIQLGAGSINPVVQSSSLLRNGSEVVPHCVIHEDNYVSSNAGLQRSGRVILNTRDAVVLMPATPFKVGDSYDVEVVVNGETHQWSFDVVFEPTPDQYGVE